jgi:radical SAM protein with 4Fe4S-binding SPASM domain
MAWKLAEHVAFRTRYFGGFLVDIRDNSTRYLNETAAEVVRLCDGTRGTPEIARTIAEKWGAAPEQAQRDVETLVQQMRSAEVLELVPTEALPVVAETGSGGRASTAALRVLRPGESTEAQSAPRLVDAQVHLTKACSLRCAHCYNSSGEALADELTTSEILSFFDQLKELGAYRITVTGGEPLFHPDIWQLLAHARELFTVVLLTNGIHLSEQNCERLRDLKMAEIYVSLDGATPETNDPLRGRNTFKHIVAGIRRGVAHDLPLSLNMAITRHNHHELDALVDLAKELGVHKVTMTPVVDLGRAGGRDDLFLTNEEIADFKLWAVKRSQAEPGMTIGELDPGGVPPPKILESSRAQRKADLCGAIRGSITLLPNGDLVPCTLMETPDLVTGNIRQQSLRDIWAHSPLHKSLRALTKDACEVCRDCTIKEMCGGACRALTFIENGSFTGPPASDECKWRRDVFARLADEVGTDTAGLAKMLGLGA